MPSIFSDTRLSFSFFLITPAKNPRTECCCQSVNFMIASIVVPLGWRSSPSTVSCLEEWAAAFAAVEAAAFVGTALADLPILGVDDRFAGRFEDFDFDFDLRAVICLSVVSTTASCAATDTSPALGAGRE